jgi:uncharacterized protein YecT (DUF1311 family)
MKTFLFVCFLASVAFAQTTPAELKKSKADYAQADKALNLAYKAAMAALGAEGQEKLRTDQRDWIQYRDDLAKAQPIQVQDDPDKPEASAAYWESMTASSDERAEWLGSFTVKGLPAGLTGEWSDSHGGRMTLREVKGGLDFAIETVRGRGHNQGEFGGLAKTTKDGAAYREEVPADEKREPCILTFTKIDGGELEVKSKNTEPFHGKGAYPDGIYRKIGRPKPQKAPDGRDEREKK